VKIVEQLHELKMEFNGTKFSMRLSDLEIEALEKEMENMNEYCQEEGEPDWTIESTIRDALHAGIRKLRREQEG